MARRHFTGRALRNDFTARWHGREGKLAGAIDDEMARYGAAAAQGDTDTAVIFTGEGADLIAIAMPAFYVISGDRC